MKPCELKSTAAWKSIKKGKKRWCDGCGVTLKYKKKNLNKKSKWWRAYCCIETGREMIFHNRLCVKFRKAKEEIRNSVTENDLDFADHHMGIDFVKDEELDIAFRPKKFWTTFDESQKRRVKYRDTIRFGVVFCKETENEGHFVKNVEILLEFWKFRGNADISAFCGKCQHFQHLAY